MESLSELARNFDAFSAAFSAPLEVEGWLLVAFAVGLLHAFDADHVMALSVFATNTPQGQESAGGGVQHGFRVGLKWALGHGAVLLLVGACFVLLGQAMPAGWSLVAERVVGAAMIFLGGSALIQLRRQRSHVHFHEHDGLPAHAHWHSHAGETAHPGRDRHQHDHLPSFVGALHGLAGSAPILALLPASAASPERGIAYLVLFGLGVAVAMAMASGAMAYVAGTLSRAGRKNAFTGMRLASATGSIFIGLWLGLGQGLGA